MLAIYLLQQKSLAYIRKRKMEWTKRQYNDQYEKWVPWLEDLYLRYFTKDNKASYATRGEFLPPCPPVAVF